MFGFGVDVLTSGNHIWDKREIYDYFARQQRLLRPANYAEELPGKGVVVVEARNGVECAVINLQGRAMMAADRLPVSKRPTRLSRELPESVKVRFVDFHAEVTSEKMAMGWYLDGRVSAMVGTHTHVPTADTRILPDGTAYQTDAGMTGPYHVGDRRRQGHHPAEIPDADAGAHGSRAARRGIARRHRRSGRRDRARNCRAPLHC